MRLSKGETALLRRRRMGLTQRELAWSCAVTRKHVMAWEDGRIDPPEHLTRPLQPDPLEELLLARRSLAVLPTPRGIHTVHVARGSVLGVGVALDTLRNELLDGITPRLPALALRLCVPFFAGEVALIE